MNKFVQENGLLPTETSTEITSGKSKGNTCTHDGSGKIMQTMEDSLHGVLSETAYKLQTGSSISKPTLPDTSIFI